MFIEKCLTAAAHKLPKQGKNHTMIFRKNLSKLISIVLPVGILLTGCGGGGSSETSMTNITPTVNAGTDQSRSENTSVTLTGTASDSDGSIASYSWTQTAGTNVTLNNASTASATFIAPDLSADEVLSFQLKVTDDDGASNTDSVNVTVEDVNVVPTVDAGVDQSVDESSIVTLSGSGDDSDGSIISYSWTQATGITVTLDNTDAATTTFTAPDVSIDEMLTFELTVTDNDNVDAVDSITITVIHIPSFTLNDTGITHCAGANSEKLDCPVVGYEGQDAEYGRDALAASGDLIKIGAGRAGFDFTKLDANGDALPDSTTSWSCVKDNHTGFVWEVKTSDDGLHDEDHTYSWQNSDPATNGGHHGENGGGYCSGSRCDTEAYVNAVNTQGLCGENDWRLPNRETLRSIVDYSDFSVVIDTDYFPNTKSRYYWSASPYAFNRYYAWNVNFGSGSSNYNFNKFNHFHVRLVRSAVNKK